MPEITLIFPHQLFEHHPGVKKTTTAALVEDSLFFSQFKFHKQKVLLHRASMKAYQQELEKMGVQTRYFDADQADRLDVVVDLLAKEGFSVFHCAYPDDYLLERRLSRSVNKIKGKIRWHDSPSFLCSEAYLEEFFGRSGKYFLTEFYIEQRKRFNILMADNKPVGGKWTFDSENRKKIPRSVVTPPRTKFGTNPFVREAALYVKEKFSHHYGEQNNFQYPVTREDAKRELNDFLKTRFLSYGIYQDAITTSDSFLFHSVLTPALNIGLLTPAEILEETIAHATEFKIPINSVEGFVRQVVGWREFIRAVYLREGVKLRTSNNWQHLMKLPEAFWKGETNILPVDNVIGKVLRTGYSNHIERLMVIGNFMLLCEIDPTDVYKWFMELFIDSYDWVMVPNVYGMSQFSSGGLMSTKPYISGSNYLIKMSDFPKGEWCEIWDALYWCFVDKHRNEFLQNPRMSMMVRLWDSIDNTRRRNLQTTREKFLEKLLSHA